MAEGSQSTGWRWLGSRDNAVVCWVGIMETLMECRTIFMETSG